jgi:glycosyltransferase involved in cell wall biosynthesis
MRTPSASGDTKLAVAQICAYYPPHAGGMEYVAQRLSEQLVPAGHDVQVLTSHVGAGPARAEDQGGVMVHYLPGFEFAHTTVAFGLWTRLWQTPGQTVWHLHLSHVYTELVVWAVACLQRRRYVAHFHMDVDTSGPLGFLYLAYKRTLLPLVMRRAARVVALSEEQRQLLIDRYHVAPERAVVIPNGVPAEYFLPLRSPKDLSQQSPLQLIYWGRFARQKHLSRLVDAVAILGKKVHLTLIGEGELEAELRQQVSDLGLSNIIFTGRLQPKEIIEHATKADCFVMTSDREGMPLALVEAMAAGLVPVVSDVQGLREFIDGNGVLVKDPSPETFASAISVLSSDPKRRAQLSAAAQKWAQDHRWSELMLRWQTLYQEVTGE